MPNTIPITVNDSTIELHKLTPRQCMGIVSKLWESGRVKMLKDLDDAKAQPELRQAKLEEWRKREGDMTLLIDRIRSIDGQDDVLNIALNGCGTKAEAVDIPLIDRMKLAGQLCGFIWSEAGNGAADDDGFERDHPQAATGGSGSSKPA